MPFTHQTGAYNVQATLYAWARAQIIVNQPPLVSSVSILLQFPEGGIITPSWSFHMLTMEESPIVYQGGHVGDNQTGDRLFGIMEINCWVSRSTVGWMGQLNQMRDAVTKAVASLRATGSAILVRDFYADASAPAALTYKINIDRVEERGTATDPNPDIERKRLLLFFNWVERA